MASGAIFFLMTSAALGIDVTLEPLSGQPQTGRLVELTSDQVVVETSQGKVTLAPKELQSLQFQSVTTSERPRVWVDLLDGSQLKGIEFRSAGGKATVELLGGEKVELLSRSLRSIRFQPPIPEIAAMWNDQFKTAAAGDLVIIRKVATRTVEESPGKEPRSVTETTLDQLEGTVLEISESGAKFDFDGDKIDVKREKMEGIIFYHPAKRELPQPMCIVHDARQSQWSARSLDLKGDQLVLTTPAGVNHSLPLASVSQIDFAAGNVLYLADMDQEIQQDEVSFQPKNMQSSFKQLAMPRKNRPFGAEALVTGSQTFARGLALHSRTRLDVRLPEGFRTFRAIAGVDDGAGPQAQFRLRILGDNKELFSKQYSIDETPKPEPIELDLAGIRRLSLIVDEGAGQDLGDQLILGNARLTK